MHRRQHFFSDTERAQMSFLSLGITFLVRVKDSEIIQNRRDVGMLRPKLFLVNLKGM
jgi:hypothetical protein